MLKNSHAELIKSESGYHVKGSLTYDTVGDLIHQKIIADGLNIETIALNCEQLARIDSAGIALFIQWQRECEQNNKKLQLVNLPSQAVSLLKANQLDNFFMME